jgi:membrane protein YdbS with pleckstrin-like domain
MSPYRTPRPRIKRAYPMKYWRLLRWWWSTRRRWFLLRQIVLTALNASHAVYYWASGWRGFFMVMACFTLLLALGEVTRHRVWKISRV